jgi:histidinol-phosphate aminotransferase
MASLAANAQYAAVPLVDYRHPLQQMLAAVTDATQLIFIANPNNPTGSYVTRAELEWFLPRVPSHVVVALDEAYFEYADAADYPDGLQLRGLHERLVVLRTFSKAYGLAGMRLGYLVAPEELTGYVNRVRAPFNASSLAQAAAVAALADVQHLERVTTLNQTERKRLSEALLPLASHVVPSQANFVYAEFDKPAAELYDRLLRRGVIVRPVPPMKYGLRISVGLPAENDRLITTLNEVLRAWD